MKKYESYSRRLRIVTESGDENFHKAKIESSKDVAEYMRQFWKDDIEIYESFFVMFLNRANNVDSWVKISQGGTVGTVIDTKIICKYAIDVLAQSVIVAHNHPTGNKTPSDADKQITKKIKDSLAFFDMQLLDHLIITKDSYLSFADNNIL